ncbi:DUF4238 domain-containing protein [Ralstonia solanacearum]|nr:DUF4238 domain-containing protein [Ralstonia solanacearum]
MPDPRRGGALFLRAIGRGYRGPAVVSRVPRRVANKDYLYAIALKDGSYHPLVECGYFTKSIDTPGSKAHAILKEQGVNGLNEEERGWWARFLCAQMIRVPAAADRMREMLEHDDAFQLATVEDLKHGLGSADELLIDELERCAGRDIVSQSPAWFPVVVQSLLDKRPFLSSHWSIHNIPTTEDEVLLGDNPFILSSHDEDRDFICVLPITPRKIFVAASNPDTAAKFQLIEMADLVRETNEFTASQAMEWVFATDDRLSDFVVAHLPREGEAASAQE